MFLLTLIYNPEQSACHNIDLFIKYMHLIQLVMDSQ